MAAPRDVIEALVSAHFNAAQVTNAELARDRRHILVVRALEPT